MGVVGCSCGKNGVNLEGGEWEKKIDSGKINDLPVVIWQFGDLLYSA
jgi:hypothetical protein